MVMTGMAMRGFSACRYPQRPPIPPVKCPPVTYDSSIAPTAANHRFNCAAINSGATTVNPVLK